MSFNANEILARLRAKSIPSNDFNKVEDEVMNTNSNIFNNSTKINDNTYNNNISRTINYEKNSPLLKTKLKINPPPPPVLTDKQVSDY
jgi:hypothetical protein